MCSWVIHHLCTRGMRKHWVVSPSPYKGPSHFLRRNGKNKIKVARTKQRLQEWLFFSSLLFKCCTSGSWVNQNTSLYNWLPSFLHWFLLDANDRKKPGKYGKQEKGLWWCISLMCSHSTCCSYTGFSAAPAWSKINWVTLCPGILEVQPHHQRYNIPSNNEVFRWCNGKREKIRRGDERDDMN